MGSDDGKGSRGQGELRAKLALGRGKLSAKFQCSQPCALRPGALLATFGASENAIYHIRAGWACQFRDLAAGHRAIIDIYLPGDVIGLDAVLRTRPLEEVMSLTSVTSEVIQGGALNDLMACQSTALYIAWLLGQRQRRADQLIASVLCLDARGRLATMLLDFYTRLRRRRLITGPTYNFPLTQIQIGRYLGLTVVHVNRVLRSLRDEHIAQVEKHCVTIFDLERLGSLALHGRPENAVVHIDKYRSNEIDLPNSEAAD
jgi:CRP/FNR family transcriptional regulator, anaerobic regulatory protein